MMKHDIFTHIDESGVNIHIDSTALREWCLANPALEVFNFPIDPIFARRMHEIDKAVSITRCQEILAKGQKFDPLIFCHDGTYSPDNGGANGLLVDGHHRYFIAAVLRWEHIPGFMLKPHQWRPFIVHGLPDLTSQDLINVPILPRAY